jgi:hypothetical protein
MYYDFAFDFHFRQTSILGIIPVIVAPVASHVADPLSITEIEMSSPSKVKPNTTNTK